MSALADAMDGYVTAVVGGQRVAVRLAEIRDVFVPKKITPVPLALPAIAGLLSLRGRVITALDLRARMAMPRREEGAPSIAIGLDRGSETYALIADRIGDVLYPDAARLEPCPLNLDPCWAGICKSIYRLEPGLLLMLDLDGVFDLGRMKTAA